MIKIPGYKGHLLFGFLFFIILIIFDLFVFDILTVPAWYWWLVYSPLLIVMTLFPDIDTPSSVARHWWTVTGLFLIIFLSLYMSIKGFILQYLIYIIITAILLIVPWFLTHRGIMHSWGMGVIIASTLLLIGSWQLFIMGLLAYWSHLLIDFLMTLADGGHVKVRLI